MASLGTGCGQTLNHFAKNFPSTDLDPEEFQRRLDAIHFKWKTFESAFDNQWLEESQALYKIAGVHLGTSDVAGPEENTFAAALDRVSRINFVYDRRDDLMRVSGVEDIEKGLRSGKPSVMFHLAGVGCFAEAEDPLTNLDLFYALGVRMSQLTYIQNNALCCSYLQEHDTGLTPLGKKVVRRMNELGIMVDLAHSGDQSSFDIIEASAEPVMISHTGCRAVYDDASNRGYIEKVFAQPYARGLTAPEQMVQPQRERRDHQRLWPRRAGLSRCTLSTTCSAQVRNPFIPGIATWSTRLALSASTMLPLAPIGPSFPAGNPDRWTGRTGPIGPSA